ncbi:Adenomatous polyposis coli protein 2 [Bienertia sinuspersici]
MEYFDKEFLAKVGSKIGKVIKIDHNTATTERIWQIQYEGLWMICYKCGKIGHDNENCPLETTNDVNGPHVEVPNGNPTIERPAVEHQDFGSWMLVKKPPPKKRQPRSEKPPKKPSDTSKGGNPSQKGQQPGQTRNGPTQGDNLGGSRFVALQQEGIEIVSNSDFHATVNLGSSSQIPKDNANIPSFNLGNPMPITGKNESTPKINMKKGQKTAKNKALNVMTNIPTNNTLPETPILPSPIQATQIPKHPVLLKSHMSHLLPSPIPLQIPPEKILCLGDPMINPYLGITDPLIHKLEVEIHSWWIPNQPKPELIFTVNLPTEVNRVFRLLLNACRAAFPNSPDLMNYNHNLHIDIPLITIMVWNAQGTGNREFIVASKEILLVNKPMVYALVETHMGGDHANKVAQMTKYSGHTRVDAQGYSGGI